MEMPLEPRVFSSQEFMEISSRLAEHHGIFYQLWNLGRPYFTDAIPTAAVVFNKDGECIDFLTNPEFWDSKTPRQKDFIVAHEMMHVVLNHGARGKGIKDKETANIAMDVVVNETLARRFGFKREEVDPDNKYCWQDKVFKDHKVLDEQNFEYYMNEIGKMDVIDFINVGDLVDDHENLPDTKDCPQKVVEGVRDSLTDEEKEDLQERLKRQAKEKEKDEEDDDDEGVPGAGGLESGGPSDLLGAMIPVKNVYVAPKRKWETIIKKWSAKFMKNEYRRKEQWLRMNRRLSSVPDAALLPSEMEEVNKKSKGRVTVYLFLDTSGSCVGFADRFWKAAKSLPEDRFDVRGRAFDTSVYDIDLKNPHTLRGGGSTAFDIIERRIQRELQADLAKGKKVQYPDAVFIITDGYGDNVSPAKPENWYWFLTPGNTDCYIHEKSHKYDLSKFE
jgi:Putative metallopeptidase domain